MLVIPRGSSRDERAPFRLKAKMIAILWCSYVRIRQCSRARPGWGSSGGQGSPNLARFTYFFKIQNRQRRVGISQQRARAVVGSVADADWWLKWRNFRLEGRAAGQQQAAGRREVAPSLGSCIIMQARAMSPRIKNEPEGV